MPSTSTRRRCSTLPRSSDWGLVRTRPPPLSRALCPCTSARETFRTLPGLARYSPSSPTAAPVHHERPLTEPFVLRNPVEGSRTSAAAAALARDRTCRPPEDRSRRCTHRDQSHCDERGQQPSRDARP